MEARLQQHELEQLSAYLDGELDDAAAAAVRERLSQSAQWRQALGEMQALDRAMDGLTVPAAPEGLAERIIAAARAERRPVRSGWVIRIGAAMAAAAAIAIMVLAYNSFNKPVPAQPGTPVIAAGGSDRIVNEVLKDVPAADRDIVENLDLYKNMDVLADMDTLEAIERQEADSPADSI